MSSFLIRCSLVCAVLSFAMGDLFNYGEVPPAKATARNNVLPEESEALAIPATSKTSSFKTKKRSLGTWGTCSTSTCYYGYTCCGNSTTSGCYAGSNDVCCNYLWACPSSTPVCCNNGYCCPSGYTCSISGSSTTCTKSKSGCFAGYETVQMESGGAKPLKDVIIGDRILSYSAAQNEFVFSPVVALLGRNFDRITEFTELWTGDGESLALTPDHLVQAGSCATPTLDLKQAKRVEVGECLATVFGPKRVLAISSVEANGAFSVVTNHDYVVIRLVITRIEQFLQMHIHT